MIIDGVILARSIVAAMPVGGTPHAKVRASTLALLLLLERRHVLCISGVSADLGIAECTARAWVNDAVDLGFAERQREASAVRGDRHKKARTDNLDGRKHIVILTAKGKQFLRRRRRTADQAASPKGLER